MLLSPNASKRQGVFVPIPAGIKLPPGTLGDRLAELLSLFMRLTALTEETRSQGLYFNRGAKWLEMKLGKGYLKTLDYAIAQGYVERNSRYSTGRPGTAPYTKSFRFTDSYRTGEARSVEVTSKPSLRRLKSSVESDISNFGPGAQHLASVARMFELSPDAALDPSLKDFWSLYTVSRFLNQQYFFVVCWYGRLHHLLTQLPRWGRKYLRVDGGEELSIIDVSACQPTILATTAADHIVNNHSQSSIPTHTLLSYVPHFCRTEAPEDIRLWVDLCEAGQLYDYFYDTVQAMSGSATVSITLKTSGRRRVIDLKALSRRQFKKQCLIPLFDKPDATKRHPIFRIVESRFPSIAHYVLDSKSNGHEWTAHLCQRRESSLMIDRLGVALQREYPSEPIGMIHDGLVCRSKFASTASELIRNQFNRIGLNPKIKTESLMPPA